MGNSFENKGSYLDNEEMISFQEERSKWLEARNKFLNIGEQVELILEQFNYHSKKSNTFKKKVEYIKFSTMASLDQGVPFYINDKCWFVRKPDIDPDTLVFDCIMEEGAQLSQQNHDFNERVDVLDGEMIDFFSDQTYEKGSVIFYKPNDIHTPGAYQKTFLKITMYKDKNVTPQGTDNE